MALVVEGGQDLLELVDLIMLHVVSERLLPGRDQLLTKGSTTIATEDMGIPRSLTKHPGLP